MKKRKFGKYLLVSMGFATISMILTYGHMCLGFYLDRISMSVLGLMIMLSGLPFLICQKIFVALNRKYKWFHQMDIFKVTILEIVLFSILMITVFVYIPVPYMFMIRREMATFAGQCLTIMCSIATAILWGIASVIVWWMKK